MRNLTKTATRQPATLSVPEGARYLGIGVNKAYSDCRAGGPLEHLTIRIGGRVMFSRTKLERFVNGDASPIAA